MEKKKHKSTNDAHILTEQHTDLWSNHEETLDLSVYLEN